MELQIKQVSKTYPGGVTALKDVSLTIPAGLFGLVGPNGAGKSTLMRTIATLQEADSGSIHFDAIDVLQDKPAVRRLLGYLPQEFGVYPRITAVAMLEHIAALKGIVSKAERRDAVDALLHLTNLHAVRKKRLGTFSGGMKQRFGIADALLGRPSLLIVDEPTAGLDPVERHRFLNLLSSVSERAVIILSTHIIDDVRELCSQMAIIQDGCVRFCGSPQDSIEPLRGRVWTASIERGDLSQYRQRYHVLSEHLLAGKTVVRVYAEAPPGGMFVPAEADLRDVYFWTIGQAA